MAQLFLAREAHIRRASLYTITVGRQLTREPAPWWSVRRWLTQAIGGERCFPVTEVSFDGPYTDDEWDTYLRSFPWAEWLSVERTNIRDTHLRHLAFMRRLQTLDISNTRISGRGLKYVVGLPRLRGLWLPSVLQLGKEGREELRKLTNLEELFFSGSYADQVADDEVLAGLTSMRNLSKLRITSTYESPRISDRGMAELGKIRCLRSLMVEGEDISDDGLASIEHLVNLEELMIQGKRITDQGMEHLTRLPRLARLTPPHQITDASIIHLQRLGCLRVLVLSSTHVTNQGRAKLSQAMPGLTIR